MARVIPSAEQIREAMLRKRAPRNYSLVHSVVQKIEDPFKALAAVKRRCPKFTDVELSGLAKLLGAVEKPAPKKEKPE